MTPATPVRLRWCALALLVSSGCAPKARYEVPAVQTAPAYRENAEWKPAEPQDASLRGNWWEIFGDAGLNDLEAQIAVSNQNLKVAEAQFTQARASVRAARAGLYPRVNSAPSVVNARASGNRAVSSFHDVYGDFLLPADVSYEADVWGRVRSAVEASRTGAQATAADLESVSLGLHAELAGDYLTRRGLDREKLLLDSAVTAYERALELTQNRFRGGVSSQADVAQAETQLETTRAQAVDIDVQRSTIEHAIAVLVGQPASTFTVPAAPLAQDPPEVPAGVPSDLLERRPDIAAAERRVASASAQVGVTTAAYYPLLTLGGATGFESKSFGSWLADASNFWTAGPAALISVFDAGRRRAVQEQARANYDAASAVYRQSVLAAFREVEDQLATLRILDEEARIDDLASAAADRSLTLANNRYRGGIATYLEVVAAQSVALADQRAAVNTLIRRMNASVLLIKALGGGWTTASLPTIARR